MWLVPSFPIIVTMTKCLTNGDLAAHPHQEVSFVVWPSLAGRGRHGVRIGIFCFLNGNHLSLMSADVLRSADESIFIQTVAFSVPQCISWHNFP